jgi:nitrogen fixation NifU-like protein
MNAVNLQSNDELRDLYRELILDHSRSPRHFGKLSTATHTAEGINPLCGDKLRLYLQLDAEQRIVDVSFEGSGCAISVASASLLSETVEGLLVKDALNFFRAVTDRLTSRSGDRSDSRSTDIDLGKILALDGVREFPTRVKCATLAWHALNSALNNQAQPVSTE